jgi:putative transcriptional regulator
LLDGGRLYGSYFHRTVILICEHNTEGSFGLVLNRSRDKSLGDVVSADVPFEFP